MQNVKHAKPDGLKCVDLIINEVEINNESRILMGWDLVYIKK